METLPTISHPLPPDDLSRKHVLTSADDSDRTHIGLVGDTYTILLSGNDTAGRYCLVDMHIPPGGGPPRHRHDFEETFIVTEGQIEATFRGVKTVATAGQTLHIPANAPHQFKNTTANPARLLCICSPAGQEELFSQVGVLVNGRTTPPPRLDKAEEEAFGAKIKTLSGKYVTELLPPA